MRNDRTGEKGYRKDVAVNRKENYEFAYKTFSPYYHSVPLKFDLEDADEVVIFSLAMGDIDYPYFQDFFRNLCDPENRRKNAKRVTIFTYDESSGTELMVIYHEKHKKN